MPRPRFARLEEERRHALLDVAAEEFAAHGYDGASLNRVIERAGLSKGVFYYYFDDKLDLFATVVDRAWEAMLPAEPCDLEALDSDNFWPTVEGLYWQMMERTVEYPWLAGVAKLIYHPPPGAGVEDVVVQQFRRARGWLRSLLERGQALRVVRTDLPGGLLLAMLVGASEAADRWLVDHWEEQDPDRLDQTARRVLVVLRRLVEPPRPEQGMSDVPGPQEINDTGRPVRG